MTDETGINLDFPRAQRLGFDEAMFCAGKTAGQIAAILGRVAERGGSMLLTRLVPERLVELPAKLRERLDYEALSGTAYFGNVAPPALSGRVAVVGAGTSDMSVCREAVRALGYHGIKATEVYDVGVAGLWRLMERVPEIVRHPVVIAVAGMDAALVSVLGGLVPATQVSGLVCGSKTWMPGTRACPGLDPGPGMTRGESAAVVVMAAYIAYPAEQIMKRGG